MWLLHQKCVILVSKEISIVESMIKTTVYIQKMFVYDFIRGALYRMHNLIISISDVLIDWNTTVDLIANYSP